MRKYKKRRWEECITVKKRKKAESREGVCKTRDILTDYSL